MSDTHDQYRVTKREVNVNVGLSNGKRLAAVIQCSERSDQHHGHERVKDVLNGAGELVPMWDEAVGSWALVNKRFIEVVELSAPDLASDEEPDLTEHRPVSVLLSTGSRLRGTLLISSPPGQSRTLDFLNRGERFFYVDTEQGLRIVNLEHVVVVSDLESND